MADPGPTGPGLWVPRGLEAALETRRAPPPSSSSKAPTLPGSETRGYTTMLLSLGAFFFSLFGLFCAVQAKSSTGNSVLVVLQPNLKRDNFTIFFDNLESEFEITCLKSD